MTGPTFLVVGGARCGTSALAEGLRTHPRVFVTDPKEPHYFAFHETGAHFTAPGDAHTVNRVSVTDTDAYRRLYPRHHDYHALGDASVSTLYYHDRALPLAHATNPDLRLVALLRQPVDRAWSAHQYMRARGLEPVEDFLGAVSLERQRMADGWHHLWHYTAMSAYAPGVAGLLATFPAEQVGVWFYDDLEADYDGTVAAILDFVGVDPAERETEEVPRVNISGQPRSKALHAGITAATASPRLRSGVKRVTSYRFRERVRRVVLRREGIPADVVDRIAPIFSDDLGRLRTLLDGPACRGRLPDWLAEVDPR